MLKELELKKYDHGDYEVDNYYEIILSNAEDCEEMINIFKYLGISYFEHSRIATFLVECSELEPFLMDYEDLNFEELYADNWRLNNKEQYIKMLNFYIYEH